MCAKILDGSLGVPLVILLVLAFVAFVLLHPGGILDKEEFKP